MPDTSCTAQSIQPSATVVGASSYRWDFCSGDLAKPPQINGQSVIVSGANVVSGIAAVNNGTSYFVFALSRNNNKLLRLDFGASLSDQPSSITEVPNVDNALLLNGPDNIRFLQEGGKWFALVVNGNNSSLVRLSFGSSLTNTPTASLVVSGIATAESGIDIVKEGGEVVVALTRPGSNTVSLLNFGTSITNMPAASDIVTTVPLAGVSYPMSIKLYKECNQWYGLVTGYSSNTVHRLNFGNSLLTSPSAATVSNITSIFPDINRPIGLSIQRDRGQVVVLVQNYASGSLMQATLGSSITSNTGRIISSSNFGIMASPQAFDFIEVGSVCQALAVNAYTNQLYRLEFTNTCSVGSPISTAASPGAFAYAKAGKYYMDVTAYDEDGNVSASSDSIVVLEATQVDFTYDQVCFKNATHFVGSSAGATNIKSWHWDFGDGTASSIQNPSHKYISAGTYTTKLTALAVNGCNSTTIKQVTIYDNKSLSPNFSFPTTLCSNSAIQFTDLSTALNGETISDWHWDFNDGNISSQQNPEHIFTKEGNYEVNLTIKGKISGCDTTIKKLLNIQSGARVDFAYNNVCIGEKVLFSNTTQPDGDWLWDFGDPSSANNTSNLKDPQHTYTAAGVYLVTLKATVANGCEVTKKIQIRIQSIPTYKISYAETCVGEQTSFEITNLVSDTTLTNWEWNFGDVNSNNNNSALQKPNHIYNTPGSYLVTLVAGTGAGCKGIVTKQIEIKLKPSPEFTHISGCPGYPDIFTDASTPVIGHTIDSWSWDFGDNSNKIITQNASHTYAMPGTYTVTLTISDNSSNCSISIAKQVKVYASPKISFDAIINCNTRIVIFTDKTTSDEDTIIAWEWDFAGQGSANIQNPSYYFVTKGTYDIKLKVTSKKGCISTSNQVIVIESLLTQAGCTQCPVISLTMPDTSCTAQSIQPSATVVGASSYRWDFCSGDLAKPPQINGQSVIVSGANVVSGIAAVNNGTSYFVFALSRNNNKLLRLDFGASLSDQPSSITEVPNVDNALLLNGPDNIRFLQEGGKWFALVVNGNNSSLVRLSFGSSLTNTPTASLVVSGIATAESGIDIVKEGGEVVVALTRPGSNTVSLLNFGTSITNMPAASDIVTTVPLAGVSYPMSIKLYKECNQWYGLVTGYSSNTVHRLNFGNSLLTSPSAATVSNITSIFPDINRPIGLSIQRDRGQVVVLVQNYASGSLMQATLGSSITSNTGRIISSSNFGIMASPQAFDFIEVGSVCQALAVNAYTNQLYRLEFTNTCSVGSPISTAASPGAFAYAKAGKYYMDVTAYDEDGNVSASSDSIIVKTSIAPSTSFTTDDQCTQMITKFFGPEEDVATWQWDFGDTNLSGNSPENTSSEQNPTHHYTTEGTYRVSLKVNSGNGCSNSITQTLTIYNNQKPTPAFSFPKGLCTYAEVAFTDQSVPASGDYVRNWRWNFGDGKNSTLQHPIHAFFQGGEYLVSLSVSGISGCDTTLTQKISVLPGANVNFDYSKACMGDTMAFANLTAPDGMWQWNFGDLNSLNNTSSDKNPRHFFSSIGIYIVTLSVTTPNGCVISRQKQIRVHTLPTIDFIYSKVCANSPISFTISTVKSDTTITGINWDFGDAGSSDNISTEESPVHTFVKAGIYTVRLSTVTASGCQGFITHQVEVMAPSNPDFSFSTACANRAVAFSDASISAPNDAINSWSWNFGDGSPLVSVKSPVHTYVLPGVYSVRLTVTGSKSSCKNTIAKQVRVYAQPQVNFTATQSCIDYSVHFTDNSTILNDQIQSREWSYGGEGTSTEKNPVFNFNRTGTFVVTLKVISTNGCSATLSRSITVDVLPEADFSFSPDFQAPPMEVKFTNNSIRATNYQWNFGDGSPLSTEVSPRHTYQAIGTYPVKLLAFRNTDCADTLIKTINVALVVLNAQVNNVAASQANGLYSVLAEVSNKGTIPITSLDFILKAGSTFTIQEKWTGVLKPLQSFIYPFKVQVVKNSFQELPYFCVETQNPNGQPDKISLDNRFCTALLQEFAVLPVYPNPGSNQINLMYILPEIFPVEVNVLDIQGKRVSSFHLDNTQIGFNDFKIDISGIASGLYMVQVIYQGQVTGQRLLKVNGL